MKNEIDISRVVPLLVIIIIAWGITFIPFKITSLGFWPIDDASTHAAKVVSGKDWSDILVLRSDVRMDCHPGWHAILRSVNDLLGKDPFLLVLFAIISLFILSMTPPLFFLRFPEAWLVSFLIVILDGHIYRLLLGRPFLVNRCAMLVIFLACPYLNDRAHTAKKTALISMLIAAAVWIHPSWYIFLIPVAALLLTGKYRAAFLLSVSTTLGVIFAGIFTGHPAVFLKESIQHVSLVLFSGSPTRTLVSELQPAGGDIFILIVIALMLIWRSLRKIAVSDLTKDPVFMAGAICWIAGFFTGRMWSDVGIMAAMVWIAREIDGYMAEKMAVFSWRRIMLAAGLLGIIYAMATNDAYGRWSEHRPIAGWLSQDNKEQAEWLPEAGGIIYSDDMGVFFQTFYKNPHARWKYILGFESAIMPEEDLRILRNIQIYHGDPKFYASWTAKMTPKDRLILRKSENDPPKIPWLEWHYTAPLTWVGRLPKNKEEPLDKNKGKID